MTQLEVSSLGRAGVVEVNKDLYASRDFTSFDFRALLEPVSLVLLLLLPAVSLGLLSADLAETTTGSGNFGSVEGSDVSIISKG